MNFCAKWSKRATAGVVGTSGRRWFQPRPRFRAYSTFRKSLFFGEESKKVEREKVKRKVEQKSQAGRIQGREWEKCEAPDENFPRAKGGGVVSGKTGGLRPS